LPNFLSMADCKQSAAKRTLPPALDESSVSEAQEGSLDWTFTPQYMMMKDGHSRCFVSTARTTQETRQKQMYLVRQLDIRPPSRKKETTEQKPPATRKPREIRVREEDLRKCGRNIELLSQFALPCMEPNMIQMKMKKKKKGTDTDGRTTIKRSSSVPTLGSLCNADASLHLPMLPSPSEGGCSKTKHHRSNSRASLLDVDAQDPTDVHDKATLSKKGDLPSVIWRNALSRRASGLRIPSPPKISSLAAARSDARRASVAGTFPMVIGAAEQWSRSVILSLEQLSSRLGTPRHHSEHLS